MNRQPKPHIYFIKPVGQGGPIKVGHSIHVPLRLRQLNKWSPLELELAAAVPVPNGIDAFGNNCRGTCEKFEWGFHQRYADHRLHDEWFAAHPLILADIQAINAGSFDVRDIAEWRSSNKRLLRIAAPERANSHRFTTAPSPSCVGAPGRPSAPRSSAFSERA